MMVQFASLVHTTPEDVSVWLVNCAPREEVYRYLQLALGRFIFVSMTRFHAKVWSC